MSNPGKKKKIMKKLLYSALALAGILAVSCNKVMEMPENPEVTLTGKTHTVVLKAGFSGEEALTRTQYADNKTFSWVAGDKVQVRCLNEETETWYWAEFVAQTTGAKTDLVGEVEDGYAPYDCAVYVPGGNDYVGSAVYNGSSVCVVAPISYHLDGFGLGYDETEGKVTPYWNSISVPSDNPLSTLPLVSTVGEDDVLYFQTGMGVLNLNLTDLDASATHVQIVTAEKYLGNYLMVRDAQISNDSPYVEQQEGQEDQVYSTRFMEYYFQPGEDHKASLYIPLPVGTIPAGSMLYVLDADDNPLFRQAFAKDVVITRNKILKLTDLKASVEWKDLGTGKYYDWYNWYFMTGSEDHVTVDVRIQQDKADANHFRIVNPYGTAAAQFGYTAEEGTAPAGAYFEFNVTEDGHVTFDAHCTGVYSSSYGEATYIDGPYGYGDFGYGRNYVVRTQSDGTPAQVALAPIVRWPVSGFWTGDSYIYDDDFIEILFPGQTAVEVFAKATFVEIVDDSPAQPVASVNLYLGSAFSGAQLVAATSVEAAEAAFTAGTAVTQASASGAYEVGLPANAASGEYSIFVRATPASGISALAANTYQSAAFQYDRSDEVWREMGKGRYVDNEVLQEGLEVAPNTYTDVEIIQNPNNAANFRVRNPYGAMIEKFGYEAPSAALPSDPYLDLTVNTDGSVYFKEHVTGVYYSSSQFSGTFTIKSPADYEGRTGFNNDHNYVAKYASDGTPANIILAPVYTWPPTDYWTGTNCINSNDFIQIVFPGFTPVDLTVQVAFEEIVDDTVSQPVASVLFDPGADIAGAYLVIAASEADAATALANSSLYTVAGGTGRYEVKLPANAASGTYYVFAKTIVGTGISEKASEILASEAFKYDRSDMNLNIKPEDLVGSYTATCSSTFAQNGWVSDTVEAVIELSDDENSGDIKFTTFVEEATDNMGIYATLDGATGKVTVDPGQVYATYSFWVDNDAQGNKVYQDLDLLLVQCGTSGGYLVPDATTPIIMRYNKALGTLTVESRQYIGIQLLDHETSASFGYYGFMYGTSATGYYVSFRKTGSGRPAPANRAPARNKERKLVPQQAPSVAPVVTEVPRGIGYRR